MDRLRSGQHRSIGFELLKDKLRHARRREGSYLLRSNLSPEDPSMLWQFYVQLAQWKRRSSISKTTCGCDRVEVLHQAPARAWQARVPARMATAMS